MAPERKLEWSNLETLCRTCHGEKSGADKRGEAFRVRYGCDEAGTSLDPMHPWNVDKTPAELAQLERKRRDMMRQEPKPKDGKRVKKRNSLIGWEPVA